MRKRTYLLLAGLGVFLIAAGYAAFYLSTTPVDGQAQTAGAPDVEWTSANISGMASNLLKERVEGVGDCDASYRTVDGTRVLEVDVDNAGPGLVCRFGAILENKGNEDAALLGSSIGLEDPGVTSWTEVDGETCGYELAASTNGRLAYVYVAFTDELEANATVDLAGGVEWVNAALFDEEECLA